LNSYKQPYAFLKVPKKTICRNEGSLPYSAKNSCGSTDGIVKNCRVKKEAVEDLRQDIKVGVK
jgi:hypothetical protein